MSSLISRLNARIDIDASGCWLWTGALGLHGYGRFKVSGAIGLPAHRVVYEAFREPIPDGHVLHHVCERKLCVNPDHLQVMSATEHNALTQRAKTHCPHGHEYTPENTIRWADGKRRCKACDRARNRGDATAWRQANRERYNAYQRERRRRVKEGTWTPERTALT